MFFRQYELGCLSLYSYMVGDLTTGRAVVVDPQRDISQYLDDARVNNLQIERVIETHFHADFLSGHLELAAAVGALVSYGPGARAEFPIEPLADGQRLSLGQVRLEIRSTPGHTPESISVVVWEHQDDDVPWGVLTGDTLFIGDVGRPDLLASAGLSGDDLARKLYRSLHERLLTLPDETRVFPAHGAGSACGRAMSSAPSSTIGEQRRTNYALAPMTEEAFVAAVTRYQPAAPPYFAFAADANRHVHDIHAEADAPASLELDEVTARLDAGAALIDCRPPHAFAFGHLRGSLNVPLEGRFAEYSGDVVRPDQEIVLVTEPGREAEARTRLARIGFDRVVGFLPEIEAVLADNPGRAERADRLTAADLARWAAEDRAPQILDVRNPSEHEAGTVPGAVLIPLAQLASRLGELDPARPTIAVCASGSRSSIAASLLRSRGFGSVGDLLGGFDAWTAAGLPMSRPGS